MASRQRMAARTVRACRTLILFVLLACGSRSAPHEHHEEEPAEEKPADDLVDLTEQQVASAGIALARVEKRRESGQLEVTAQIEAAPDGQARVGVRIPGRITKLAAGIGDKVKKGQLLAVVDSPELGRALADYLSTFTSAELARQTADREKALFDKHISSERDWREAEAEAVRTRAEKEAAENRLHALGVSDAQLPRKLDGHYASTLTVTAPIDGIVVEREVTLGQMVEPDDTLFLLMNLDQAWIAMDVYERDLAQVKLGQKVRVTVAAYADRVFEGTVANIGAVVESKTRAIKVRVALANPDGALKPGMFATALIAGSVGEAREGLFVPASAVQRDGERYLVFVPRGERRYEPREIVVGHEVGELVSVERGLAEGDTVVTRGGFLLKAELKKSDLGGGHSH
jgi:cobalt-zinc-cadmium efflux system membrane fusion protein